MLMRRLSARRRSRAGGCSSGLRQFTRLGEQDASEDEVIENLQAATERLIGGASETLDGQVAVITGAASGMGAMAPICR